MNTYLITPLNEGQELNYSEIFKGTYASAESRARKIVLGLRHILKQGMIDVMIERSDMKKTFYPKF